MTDQTNLIPQKERPTVWYDQARDGIFNVWLSPSGEVIGRFETATAAYWAARNIATAIGSSLSTAADMAGLLVEELGAAVIAFDKTLAAYRANPCDATREAHNEAKVRTRTAHHAATCILAGVGADR